MAEAEEPREIPMSPPGSPLPRIWKFEPEPDEEETPAPKKKKKKKRKGTESDGASKPGKDGEGGKGVLIEETPALDTIEARQTARIVAGVVLGLLILLIGFVIFKVLAPAASDDQEVVDEGTPTPRAPVDPKQAERDARSLFNRARDVAAHGNVEFAMSQLAKVRDDYPNTAAGREASESLARAARKQPLFVDKPAEVAGAATKGAAKTAKPRVPEKSAEPPRMAVADASKGSAAPLPQPAPVPGPGTTPAPGSQPAPAAVSPATSESGSLQTPAPSMPQPTAPDREVAAMTKPVPKPTQPESKPLPAGFKKREGTAIHASGWPNQIVGERDGAAMVLVPGGTFTMGRDDGDSSEGPAHKVSMSAFYIDQHEVTNHEFDVFQMAAGRRLDRNRALARLKPEDRADASEDSPVVMVSAGDADEYAKWAGKQLPTEAQWELAARGLDGRLYPWGVEPPQWAKPRKPRQIDPVGSFSIDVSPFGASDMAGNAWEWTRDWYDHRYHHLLRNSAAANPTGPPSRPKSAQLTVKGLAKNWTVTKREGLKPDTRLPYLGFRCVLPLDGSGGVPGAGQTPVQGPAGVPGQTPANPNAGAVPF
jgi:formylglycine-generating enzyme required for sulfatase activity